MPSDYAPSTSVLLQSRTRAASVWLARSRVTASNVMKAMMGKDRVTIHSAIGGRIVFSLDWSGPLIVIQGDGIQSPYRFHDLRSAIAFFDAALLNHAAGPSEPCSTVSDLLEVGAS